MENDARMVSVQMAGSEWFETRPGGLNRYFQDLFFALAANSSALVHASAFGPPPRAPSQSHSRTLSWGDSHRGLLRRAMASRRTEAPSGPDILDRHFALYGPSARAVRAHRQIIHFQGPWADESAVSGQSAGVVGTKRLIERAGYRRADHFVVLSKPFAGILEQRYGISPDRISIIPPGVDLAKFEVNTAESDHPVVLCVRRLERRMGIDVLIRAWGDVVKRTPEAKLQIVGTGTAEKELRELAAMCPAARSISFLGRVSDEDLRNAYREARVTVVPTTALEGFGLIALESLAAGRAPIVTDCGGLPDAVQGLAPDLIVPAGSADALSERISGALEDGSFPSPQECRSHAERFAWSEVADRHLELYRQILEGTK